MAQPGGGVGGAAQLHGNAGQQLPGVEGLGEVVRRAVQQQADLFLHVPPGGEHDHRNPGQMGQHLLAAQARQHQIQQHQIRPPAGEEQQRLRA